MDSTGPVSVDELFPGLSDDARRELLSRFERVQVASGDTLIRQGEPADCMYVLVSGRLRASVERDGEETVVGEVGRGEVVGEMALLIDEPRSATVRAIRESELLKLSKDVFDAFIEKNPSALKQIVRTNVHRLRRSILAARVPNTVATIAVIPAGREAPLRQVAEALAASLSGLGTTVHVTRERCERELGSVAGAAAPEARGDVASWLNQLERQYRYVVYESDTTDSSWTQCCVRQADHIVAVGVAGADAALGEVEARLQPVATNRVVPRVDLVLVHPADAVRPSGTDAWLASRAVHRHHHVRTGRKADYDRIARFVTGRAVGVVLGGGGARGMAHIGALRAIQELGIPIDMIGGTSAGALIAGAFASGSTCEDTAAAAKRFVVGKSPLDYTLPLVSLAAGRRLTNIFRDFYGDVKIEDLWVNYFCVSTNLSRATVVVHRRGALWHAIRASVSLPGILPPLVHDGDLLVDGGLMNRLPVDVMRERCNGLVIAVNVSTHGLAATDAFGGPHVSGWRLLWRRLNPFASKVAGPNLASILLASTLVKSAHSTAALEKQADICVQVRSSPLGLFDFNVLDAIIDGGYQAARAQLEGWSSTSRAQCWTPRASAATTDADRGPSLSEALHTSV